MFKLLYYFPFNMDQFYRLSQRRQDKLILSFLEDLMLLTPFLLSVLMQLNTEENHIPTSFIWVLYHFFFGFALGIWTGQF